MPTPILDIDQRTGNFAAFWSEGRRSKRKSMGTPDRTVAEARFAEWLLLGGHRAAAPGEALQRKLTVAELWKVYDKSHVQKNVAAPETAAYSWRNLEPHFGKLTLDQIDEDVIEDYLEARTEGDIGKPSVSSTVRRELSALVACMNWHAAPERGKKRLIKAQDVPHIALPAESAPRDRWLATAEIKALFDVEMTPRLRMFLWLALETAARKRAILDLTWDRVDLETGMIQYAVPGKKVTKKRRPSVPISATLRRVLEAVPAAGRVGPVVPPGGDVWPQIQSAVRRAGLSPAVSRDTGQAVKATGVSPHTFRHTAATHMARRGVPLYVIAGVLGNTLAMVERVYSHHCPERLKSAVDMISGPLETV